MQAVKALKASQGTPSPRKASLAPYQAPMLSDGGGQQDATPTNLPLAVILDAVDNLVDER